MADWKEWVLPPAWRDILRRVPRAGRQTVWQFDNEAFAKPARGWNMQAIVDLQRANWPQWTSMVASADPLGLNFEAKGASMADLASHNTLMAYAYAAARASHGKDRLRMLDFGGGLGHYSVLTRALFPQLTLDYSCFDQPLFCEAGAALLPADRFYDDIDAALSERYDFVLASSSLWLVHDWRTRFAALANAASEWVFVTRQIIVATAPTFSVVQRPAAYGYPTEFPVWIMNRRELLNAADHSNLQLEREFLVTPGPIIHGAPEHGDYRGFLFRKRQ